MDTTGSMKFPNEPESEDSPSRNEVEDAAGNGDTDALSPETPSSQGKEEHELTRSSSKQLRPEDVTHATPNEHRYNTIVDGADEDVDGALGDGSEAYDSAEADAMPIDPARWLSSETNLIDTDWPDPGPAIAFPVEESWRRRNQTYSASRRRRRYTLYVRRTARAREAAKSSTVARAAWATSAILLALIAALITSAVAAAASYYHSEESLLRGLSHQILAKDSVRIFDSKGTLLYQFNEDGSQHSIPLAKIPVTVVNATTAIEDHDFWVNQGVDFTSILRAVQADLQSGRITQGGSTITQQLIKQQLLGGDVSFTRKLNEAVLAFGVTAEGPNGSAGYSKRQILEMYLNSIPYSPTAYGVEAAAEEYFGYKADPTTGRSAAQQLDLAQASMLAGIPQNPNLNDPLLNPEHAKARHEQVLNAMVQYGYITPEQAKAADEEAQKPNFFHPVRSEQNLAPHFVYYVRDQLEQMIGTGQLRNLARSGLNVYTTLDMDMQNHAQEAMKEHLFGTDTAGYPPHPYIRNSNVSNAAEIMVDHHTGGIKVYLGSVDYFSTKIDGKFDVVSQGYRGPGSSFKPFVYATAFEKGWFPAFTLLDQPTAFWDAGAGTDYRPLDFDTEAMVGRVTIRTALDWSLNVPAIKAMQFAGIDDVKQQLARMGITETRGTWGLSSVLGAIQITPFEMAQAYTVFANYGQYIPLHAIDKITDSAGNVLFNYVPPRPVQVMDPRVAFLMTSILSDNASRAGDFGPCSPLYLAPYFGTAHPHYGDEGSSAGTSQCGRIYAGNFLSPDAWPTAAKTGTGQDFKDDWTMGFTMDYTAAVWVGNNDNTPMIDIDGVTGAAPIFYQSMMYAESSTGKAKTPFPVPQGVHKAQYCSVGTCTLDWFLDGSAPPVNLGEGDTPFPCVSLKPGGGWDYSSVCQVALEHKGGANIGAPAYQTAYVGAP